jgi:FdhD protein
MKEEDQGIGEGRVIRRREDGSLEFSHDDLTREEPLEIRIGDKLVATTMRTPGQDEELAAGFLITEGLIKSIDAIESFVRPNGLSNPDNVIMIILKPGQEPLVTAPSRLGTITSSCGLCGRTNIAAVRATFPPLAPATGRRVAIETLLSLPESLRQEQGDFARTGGIHAAGLFDFEGRRLVIREDIGRHNAVDKAIGRALLDQPGRLSDAIVMVSGRASFEIMQKAYAAGIPVVASVSAPSALAMDFARETGQTLVGFLRPPTFNVYTHVERIILPD